MKTEKTLHRIKLHSFKDQAKFDEYVEFLDTQEKVHGLVSFVVCPCNDAVLVQFEPHNVALAYYYNVMDYLDNKPIIAVGRDCGADTMLNEWEIEQLDMKLFVMRDL